MARVGKFAIRVRPSEIPHGICASGHCSPPNPIFLRHDHLQKTPGPQRIRLFFQTPERQFRLSRFSAINRPTNDSVSPVNPAKCSESLLPAVCEPAAGSTHSTTVCCVHTFRCPVSGTRRIPLCPDYFLTHLPRSSTVPHRNDSPASPSVQMTACLS